MLGQKIRELREARGLVQREIAAILEVDTAYVSKMESNEKPVSRHHLKTLANMLGAQEKDLEALWLADRILKTVHQEEMRKVALELVIKTIK